MEESCGWCPILLLLGLEICYGCDSILFWGGDKTGVFDFMQRHENRSVADLKQCMPVRNFVRLEPPRVASKYREMSVSRAVSPERLRER